MSQTDFLVIGAGIVGLTIACELKRRHPDTKVRILEKETTPGLHSSGRNSGVLHSGIYYPPASLKARVCGQGAKEMAAYCKSRGLPLNPIGKVLVATRIEDDPQIDLLASRAESNGIVAELIDEQTLREIEPEARSATGRALFVASTSVGSPQAVMQAMLEDAATLGVDVSCSAQIIRASDQQSEVVLKNGEKISYGHVVNAAGLHADRIAHLFDVGQSYTLLPFKGIYWKLNPKAGLDIRHLIYPVPDLRVPFLGVHTTTSTDGTIYLGPTAVPAFGRENYRSIEGVTVSELARISTLLLRQYALGHDGFRQLAWQEGRRYFKPWFAEAARAILPKLKPDHLLPTEKVGIRAQMLDRTTGRLVTDFLVESGKNSTHVLNAISPAWTSSFPFARYVCDNFIFRSS